MSESEIQQLITANQSCSNDESQPGEVDTSYCFKWNNYQNHLSEVVRQLLDEESMVDVTLWAGGERIHAHRLVLCACSTLFQEILSQVNDEHATIILSDISADDLKCIIEFCYNGEVRIPVENFNNWLGAVYSLKIYGLMEIGELTEIELCGEKGQEDTKFNFNELSEMEEVQISENIDDEGNEKKEKVLESDETSGHEEPKRRKSVSKKDYSDEDLAAAIADIKSGSSLLEAAAKNHIPRSTLYMRAKILNVPLNPSRSEYTNEDMKAAIQDVLAGSSLQQAALCHGIPKTVLWRRIQKEGHERIKREARRSYGTEKREAAIKALARGECLTKVANEYKIPKTTLFRDKARLVDEGKLPSSFYKKRKSESEEQKQSRLIEAVAACKNGRMSQAIASVTYQIPKTTIWRHLQKENVKNNDSEKSKNEQKKTENVKLELAKTDDEDLENLEVYCGNTEMDITYIDESSISDDPVIILTSGSVDDLNLPNNQLVVVHEDENFVSCGLELDENSTFEMKS